jgi:hypothetical protein
VLLEEWVADQFLDVGPVCRVLLQTAVEEVPHLVGYEQIGRDLDLVFHNLDQFLFFCDLEGVFPDYHLVHHYAD